MKTSNKILIISFAIVVVLLLAGLITTRSIIYASFTSGDGSVTETRRQVEAFENIKITGKYQVYFTQGPGGELLLSADANLHEFITTEVRNGELVIESNEPIRSSNEFRIEVSSPTLRRVEAMAASGFFTTNPLNLPELDLFGNAGSRMEVEGTFETVKVEQNAGANITLHGQTDKLEIISNAGGIVDAYELEAQSAEVEANAGASARINALEIDASANAGASIKYIGSPNFKDMSTNAGGSISKRNN